MNPRALNVFMVLMALFVIDLFYVGHTARENRKQDYLELTHRVTAGQATPAQFEKLAGYLAEDATKSDVRSLFGLPVARAKTLVFDKSAASTTAVEYWLYYPRSSDSSPTVDAENVETLKGEIKCFVVEFDKRGRAKARLVDVIHPLEPTFAPVSK